MALPPGCRFGRLSRYGAGRSRFVRTTFVPGDETCFVFLEAEAADVVAEAGRRAGLAFERVVPAIEAT
jgi:hypothetical protein